MLAALGPAVSGAIRLLLIRRGAEEDSDLATSSQRDHHRGNEGSPQGRPAPFQQRGGLDRRSAGAIERTCHLKGGYRRESRGLHRASLHVSAAPVIKALARGAPLDPGLDTHALGNALRGR